MLTPNAEPQLTKICYWGWSVDSFSFLRVPSRMSACVAYRFGKCAYDCGMFILLWWLLPLAATSIAVWWVWAIAPNDSRDPDKPKSKRELARMKEALTRPVPRRDGLGQPPSEARADYIDLRDSRDTTSEPGRDERA